jgi:hypothetical protein
LDIVGERTEELGTVVKADEKELILWIGCLEKLESSLLGFPELVCHATAEIQDDADGDRHVFGREIHDFLFDLVFEDAKVLGLKTRDETVIRVGYGDVDKRQIHVDMKGLALLDRLARCIVFYVAGDEGLGEDGHRKIRDGDAKEKEED